MILSPSETPVSKDFPANALFPMPVTGFPRNVSGMTISPFSVPNPETSYSVLPLISVNVKPGSCSRVKRKVSDQPELR